MDTSIILLISSLGTSFFIILSIIVYYYTSETTTRTTTATYIPTTTTTTHTPTTTTRTPTTTTTRTPTTTIPVSQVTPDRPSTCSNENDWRILKNAQTCGNIYKGISWKSVNPDKCKTDISILQSGSWACIPGNYTYDENKDDIYASDLSPQPNLANNITKLKEWCDANKDCQGFNTDGYMKSGILVHPSTRVDFWKGVSGKGFYTKKSVVYPVLTSKSLPTDLSGAEFNKFLIDTSLNGSLRFAALPLKLCLNPKGGIKAEAIQIIADKCNTDDIIFIFTRENTDPLDIYSVQLYGTDLFINKNGKLSKMSGPATKFKIIPYGTLGYKLFQSVDTLDYLAIN